MPPASSDFLETEVTFGVIVSEVMCGVIGPKVVTIKLLRCNVNFVVMNFAFVLGICREFVRLGSPWVILGWQLLLRTTLMYGTCWRPC